ncbi:MAG: hypothetical protein EBZ74_11385, partial [Planctomycetia bacterium]|nr:hypothetical protein [Planctomycetia bacterium]
MASTPLRPLSTAIRSAVKCALVLLLGAAALSSAQAQIVVGGNGGDQVDSNLYSGTQSLTKIGSNAVALTGNNSYSGGTVVNGGVLQLPSDTALGASGGSITLNGGQLGLYGNDMTLGSARVITLGTSGGFLSAGWNKSFSVAGPIGGSGGLGIAWEAGVVYLNGSNSYAGTTTIGTSGNYFANAGANLRLGNASALPTGTPIVFGASANTATLDVQSYAINVGSLNGSSNARISNGGSGTPTVSINVASGTATYGGQINGNVTVTKTGAATQVLSGTNSYSGATTVSGGRLQLGAGTSDTVSSSSGFAINNGSTLGFGGTRIDFNTSGGSARTITFGTSGSNTLDTGSGVNIVDWVGNTYTTTGGARNVITGSSGLNIASGVTATLNVARGTDPTSDLTVSSRFWNSGAITKTGSGILTVTGSFENTGGTTISAGDGGTTGSLGSGGITNNAALVVNRSDALTFSQAMSGSGSFTQAGLGTTTFTGANTYSGTTTISSGTLQVGNGGTAGSLGAGAVVNNGALIFNRSDAVTAASVISGTGSVTKTGGGVSGGLRVTGGAISVTSDANLGATGGSVDLDGGTINVGTVTIAAARPVRLGTNNGYITTTGGGVSTFAAALSGSGGLGIGWDAGTTVLSGSNSYSGPTTIGTTAAYGQWNDSRANPTLKIGNANALPTASALVFGSSANSNTATLDLNGFNASAGGLTGGGNAIIDNTAAGAASLTAAPASGTSTFGGVIKNISGAVSLIKGGAGWQVLSGSNTYSGGTVINGGVLQVATDAQLGATAGSVTLNGGQLFNNDSDLALNASRTVTL